MNELLSSFFTDSEMSQPIF